MPDPILRVTGLKKQFPGVQALDGAGLDVYPGEVMGLIGENGAGKSTMIKILAGVKQPDEGIIEVKGQAVEIPDPIASQALGISVIFQELNLIPNLTVSDNIFVGRELRRSRFLIDDNQSRKLTRELLGQTGLHINPNTRVEDLPLSQRQMVEVAKALSIHSSLIIMDEPTSSLTGQEVERLFEIIKRLTGQGVAVIFVSHKLEEVFQICDRIHVLRDGKDVGTKPASQLSHDEVIKMMVGRELGSLFVKEEAEITEPILEVENISSHAGIENVSFSLRKGEILGFAGLVGAGRTEVMRAVFGVDERTAGTIRINGKEVNIRTPFDAIKHRIGLIPEDRKDQGLILEMMVRHNTTLPGLPFFFPNGILKERKEYDITRSFIEKLSIRTPSQEQEVLHLSGGNQQKVVVAKWLALEPRILILDEPTRGIDVAAKKEIHRLITELAKDGVGVIIISSEMSEVLAMSDRIVVMHEGRKKGELERGEATQEKIMEMALRTTQEELHHAGRAE
ncbi:MAG: sugar ABC transporter ATP-binding protein [Spirochaetales bacterium]|nr:sugar ABC transporter ATP-binding protein [Spirochaetales bacterium]MCF7938682.1 sugar ABC transporter ATP-binding protein [Spirochaetales bacterium]